MGPVERAVAGAVFLAVALSICWGQAALADGCAGRSDEPLVGLLQPPPCEACEETKAELDELAALEKARTPEQVEQAARDAERSLPRFLEGAGIVFDAEALKPCEDFFLKRRKDESASLEAAKSTFCRPRPYATSGNALHPIERAKPEVSFSYPSGHSTYGATTGFLLAAMMPEKKAAIYARINGYAHSRMVAGVHFRSDVEAGKLYGTAIATALFARPGFQAEFEEAKVCVRKAVGMQ
jgi:acid phosphatase (class A)